MLLELFFHGLICLHVTLYKHVVGPLTTVVFMRDMVANHKSHMRADYCTDLHDVTLLASSIS